MAIGSEITTDIMHKTGRDLLPEKTVEYFLEIRDIEHWNIVNITDKAWGKSQAFCFQRE